MSWSDPAQRFEPAEDVQLRAELRELLGLGEIPQRAASPVTEALSSLADDLRKEAQRRRRTERHRPSWGLLAAAALPLLAAMAGLGTWGFQQKQRADSLAVHVQSQASELNRIAAANAADLARERKAKEDAQHQLQLVAQAIPKKSLPYLVIPVDKPLRLQGEGYHSVKEKPGQ
jgi:hypothetical protein